MYVCVYHPLDFQRVVRSIVCGGCGKHDVWGVGESKGVSDYRSFHGRYWRCVRVMIIINGLLMRDVQPKS